MNPDTVGNRAPGLTLETTGVNSAIRNSVEMYQTNIQIADRCQCKAWGRSCQGAIAPRCDRVPGHRGAVLAFLAVFSQQKRSQPAWYNRRDSFGGLPPPRGGSDGTIVSINRLFTTS